MVQQWEGAVKILNQRDEDTNRAVDEIRNLKSVAKERIKDLEEQKSFFENEEKNNKELEKDIDNLNKQQYEIKQHIILVEQSIGEEVDKVRFDAIFLKINFNHKNFSL